MGTLFLMCCMSSILSSGAGAAGYFIGYIPGTVKYYERKILELIPEIKSIMSSLELNDGEVNLFVPEQFSNLKKLVESVNKLDDIGDSVKQSDIKLSEHVTKQVSEISEAYDLFNLYKDEINKIDVFIRGLDEIIQKVKGNEKTIDELKKLNITANRDENIQKYNEIIKNDNLTFPNDTCTIVKFLSTLNNGFKSFNEYINSKIPETKYAFTDVRTAQQIDMNHIQGFYAAFLEKC